MKNKDNTLAIALETIIPLTILGAVFGFIASQYFPFWGFWTFMSVPFSYYRLGLAPAHVVLFAAIGAFLGWIFKKKK